MGPRFVRLRACLVLAAFVHLALPAHAEPAPDEPRRPPRLVRAELAAAAPAATVRAASTSAYDPLWTGYPLPTLDARASGPRIRALVPWDGGIVAGTQGDYFGTTTARCVALWDGIGWQPLGDGPPTAEVNALAVHGGMLVAGGRGGGSGLGERPAVFAWDGAGWTSIGSANGSVFALVVMNGELYAGGDFTSVNGVPAGAVARWDGAGWHAVGAGFAAGSTVNALAVHGTSLVAGGSFSGTIQRVLQWDGATWSQLGAGLSGNPATAMVSDGTTLYVTGWNTFSSGGSSLGSTVVTWNGATWSGIPGGAVNSFALALHDGFPMATIHDGSAPRPHLWNGAAWQAFNQADVTPYAYATDGSLLYAGGTIASPVGGAPTMLGGFCSFDGTAWTTVQQAWAPGMRGLQGSGGAWCAQEYAGSLYVGGGFSWFGAEDHLVASSRIARWDGTSWHPIGSTPHGIWNMTVWEDSLVANMNGYVVRVWTGSAWRGLQANPWAPFDGDVMAITTHQGRVHAFGPVTAEGVAVNGVTSWSGTAWEPVGAGVDPYYGAYCGTTWGTSLVVAGDFTSAGGGPARRIAYWDGADWHPMGTGVNDEVWALTEFAGDLVAGGYFTEAGGESVHAVARFDGAAWHAMGSRARDIQDFHVHNGRLYAAGAFLDDLGQLVRGAALWTGSEWLLLGSGVGPTHNSGYGARALGSLGDDLYLIGVFNEANGHPARGFAKLANVSTLDVPGATPRATRLALAPTPNPSRAGVRFAVTLPAAGRARLVIHDVSGREVARLLDGAREAGTFSLAWEGRVEPGLYFATLECAGARATTRVVRLR